MKFEENKLMTVTLLFTFIKVLTKIAISEIEFTNFSYSIRHQ